MCGCADGRKVVNNYLKIPMGKGINTSPPGRGRGGLQVRKFIVSMLKNGYEAGLLTNHIDYLRSGDR